MNEKDPTAPQLNFSEGRATIQLSRPAEHNRIAPSDIGQIMRHLDEIERQKDTRVLVWTGLGDKTFSSGYTLGAIRNGLDSSFEDMLNRIEAFPLPTICALNGSVYGGGTDIAICCDWRIGVQGIRMFVPAARFGLHYYPGGLRRFVTRLGPVVAKRIFLTCMPLNDEEMLRCGFLQDLVERKSLDDAVEAYCSALQEGDAQAIASMKIHIDALASGNMDDAYGRKRYQETLASDELERRLSKLNG
jgi:enoyl-CoA hydratase/carnithine racemase